MYTTNKKKQGMSTNTLLNEPEFQKLQELGTPKSHKERAAALPPNGTVPPTGTTPAVAESREELTADRVKDIIERHGMDALPRDVISRLPYDEQAALGPLLFDIVCRDEGGERTDFADLWFTPAPFLQCGLPSRRKVGRTQHFSRNGNVETTLSVPVGSEIPYGIPGRLALAFLTTEVVRTGDRLIQFEETRKELVEEVFGVAPTPGARGTMARYTESLASWAKVTAQFVGKGNFTDQTSGEEAEGEIYRPLSISEECFLWGQPGFGTKSKGWLKLSEEFFELATNHAVPIEKEFLNKVGKIEKSASAAYDLYYWCLYRQYSMRNKGEHFVRISWRQIQDQFFAEEKKTHRVKNYCREAVAELSQVGIQLPLHLDERRGLLMTLSKEMLPGAATPKS